jgi:antitoxin (DNA-binding transcriptional repressor) of toxin-antitoxin stability system
VTERGRPIALIQPIQSAKHPVTREAILAKLAARGLGTLPRRKARNSPLVTQLVEEGGPVATAAIAYAGVPAAFERKQRDGELVAADHTALRRRFEREWKAYVIFELHRDVLRLARDPIWSHPSPGFDSIHLASCLVLGSKMGEEMTFAAADEALLRAAEGEPLRALDVETDRVL